MEPENTRARPTQAAVDPRIHEALIAAEVALADLGACDDPKCKEQACVHALAKVRRVLRNTPMGRPTQAAGGQVDMAHEALDRFGIPRSTQAGEVYSLMGRLGAWESMMRRARAEQPPGKGRPFPYMMPGDPVPKLLDEKVQPAMADGELVELVKHAIIDAHDADTCWTYDDLARAAIKAIGAVGRGL